MSNPILVDQIIISTNCTRSSSGGGGVGEGGQGTTTSENIEVKVIWFLYTGKTNKEKVVLRPTQNIYTHSKKKQGSKMKSSIIISMHTCFFLLLQSKYTFLGTRVHWIFLICLQYIFYLQGNNDLEISSAIK